MLSTATSSLDVLYHVKLIEIILKEATLHEYLLIMVMSDHYHFHIMVCDLMANHEHRLLSPMHGGPTNYKCYKCMRRLISPYKAGYSIVCSTTSCSCIT